MGRNNNKQAEGDSSDLSNTGNQSNTENAQIRPDVHIKHCLENCKYNRQQRDFEMLRCCGCMTWVHPQCCGDDPVEESRYRGGYSCAECRQMGKRIHNIERQMKDMYQLNMDLMTRLEKSQEECASLREILHLMLHEQNSSVKHTHPNQEKLPITAHKNAQTPQLTAETPTNQKPKPKTETIPKPSTIKEKPPKKPKVTLIGDSMVRGCGVTLAAEFKDCDTCTLSKSGQNIARAGVTMPDIVNDHTERDTVVLQLGNNDLKNSTHEEIADRYCRLVDLIKRSSNCSVVVTALPHHISAGSAATNQTVDKVNNSLRSLCAKDNICTFIDCNPELQTHNYKEDGVHFSSTGTKFFASTLAKAIKSSLNFQEATVIQNA